jgi:hypothetical protein
MVSVVLTMTEIRQRIESALNQLSPYILKKALQTVEVKCSAENKIQLIDAVMNEILEAGVQGLISRLTKPTVEAALAKFNISVAPSCDLEEAQMQLEDVFMQQSLRQSFEQCGDKLLREFCADLRIVPQQVATELGMYELLWFALRSKKNVHVRYLM